MMLRRSTPCQVRAADHISTTGANAVIFVKPDVRSTLAYIGGPRSTLAEVCVPLSTRVDQVKWAESTRRKQLECVQNEVPEHVIDAVTARDGGVCCVTGRTDLPTTVMWLFPPSRSLPYLVGSPWDDFDTENPHEAYRTVDNAITLCNPLIHAEQFEYRYRALIPNHQVAGLHAYSVGCHIRSMIKSNGLPTLASPSSRDNGSLGWVQDSMLNASISGGGNVTSEEHDPDPDVMMDEPIDDRTTHRMRNGKPGSARKFLPSSLNKHCLKRANSCDDDNDEEGSVDGTDDQFFSNFGESSEGASLDDCVDV
ncbi:hypothetical protein C8R45DRAFT_1075399 [Mycena sanguinolenta]|nr:hypothetical protein C8R45DRAFT_1075399 [Mycena sanguinolenta]